MYRVSQRKVWLVEPGAKFYLFLCATLLWGVFFSICWIFEIWLQKNPRTFFLSKSKVQKSKNVWINYFNRNLKVLKDWITKSHKFRKIVKIKFAIFSSGQIFKDKLFFNGSSGFHWRAYIYNFRKKELEKNNLQFCKFSVIQSLKNFRFYLYTHFRFSEL